jgi:hypothetical protein
MKAGRCGAHLADSSHDSVPAVQAGSRVHEIGLPHPVHLALGQDVPVQPEQQLLRIERKRQQVPGTGLERGNPLLAADRPRLVQDQRCGRGEVRGTAQLPAQLETIHVRQHDVDEHGIGT